MDLERTVKRRSLELVIQTAHDLDDCRSCLDLSSEIGYVLLTVSLLKLDLFRLNFVLNPKMPNS